MKNTKYVDASGISVAGTSTATDQLLLTQAAMQNPVFAEIVNKKQATVPVAGTIFSTDTLLGKQGIVGVKTGWTEQAGGNFVFAAKANVDGRQIMVYGAVLGQDTLESAFAMTERLVPAIVSNLHYVKVIPLGTTATIIDSQWEKKTDVKVDGEVELLAWPGMVVRTGVSMSPLGVPVKAGSDVGAVRVQAGDQSRDLRLKAETTLPGPTHFWKVFR
jgi:D-alanyl-D-alanine carboxypeptidase (penicillin-binding protein 5/6)